MMARLQPTALVLPPFDLGEISNRDSIATRKFIAVSMMQGVISNLIYRIFELDCRPCIILIAHYPIEIYCKYTLIGCH